MVWCCRMGRVASATNAALRGGGLGRVGDTSGH